ncbi:conserved Plasmodium protein, unknown function [Plasmodium ovale]|nr:conserved Plasmodium protein, unknown function [Plasmodium ovale]
MSCVACPFNYVNISQNQKEDLLRFEVSAIANYKYYKEIEIRSRIRVSLIVLLISLMIYVLFKYRDDKTVVEIINNLPLMIFVCLFFIITIKHSCKNLFKSTNYIKSLNKTLKAFNLHVDKKSLKLCIIGSLQKEQ